MSDWPTHNDYHTMMQNPQAAFPDPGLKACVIECHKDANGNPTKQPVVRSGAFACVYKGTYASGGDVAVRVFTSRSEERRDRYGEICKYLENRKKLRCLVGFKYSDAGIKVAAKGGKKFPLLTMDWVPGVTLFDWVRVQSETGNRRSLGEAAERWVDLVQELKDAQIAHGDLQHANVMVTPAGELKLVDYDCMCVPALVGRPNLELGVVPYQLPRRNETTQLFLGLDHFSAMYIFVVLRALSADPNLWQRYNVLPMRADETETQLYDKLLFHAEDFNAPSTSAIYRDLQNSPDAKVRKWTDELFRIWAECARDVERFDLRSVPELPALLVDLKAIWELLAKKDFDAAVGTAAQAGTAALPADLQAAIDAARQRVARRSELEQAVQSGDEQAMQRLYDPRLLDDYPRAQPAVAVAKLAPQVVPVLAELDQQKTQPRRFVQVWDAKQNILHGRKSAEAYRRDVDHWRQRNQLCDTIQQLTAAPDCDVARLKAEWTALQGLGGHPEVHSQASKISHLIERHDAFQKFQQLPSRAPGEHNDSAVVAAWNESLFNGWPTAERERGRLQAAQQRLDHLNTLRVVIQQNSRITLDGESKVYDAGSTLPQNYEPQLQERVSEAQRRLVAFENLKQACQQTSPSEIAMAAAWQTLVQLRAESLVDPATRDRLERAAQRVPLLQQLQAIPRSLPLNEYDRRLLAVWDEALLENCPQANEWWSDWKNAFERRNLLERLGHAIQQGTDKAAVAKIAKHPLLVDYPFEKGIAEKIRESKEAVERTRRLLEVLEARDQRRFAGEFNVYIIREFPAEFARFQPLIFDWVGAELRPLDTISLHPLTKGPQRSIAKAFGENGLFEVRWQWPDDRFTEKCLLKLCRANPGQNPEPETVEGFQSVMVLRKAYEDGGGCWRVRAADNWLGWCWVSVWACFDLGFQTLYSKPLVLGQLPRPRK